MLLWKKLYFCDAFKWWWFNETLILILVSPIALPNPQYRRTSYSVISPSDHQMQTWALWLGYSLYEMVNTALASLQMACGQGESITKRCVMLCYQ